ncbi:MAG: cupin domain-containing protein [Pseudomonadota bacterium]
MNLNSDFDERVLVHSGQLEWQASPMVGVERRMLDRIGGEIARATSIVRYAPGSHFSPHTHTGGEEFIVLEGVFQDEHGDYPVGTYVRNPPDSKHTPGSEPGCVIFVKLWQFDLADRTPVVVDMNESTAVPDRNRSGRAVALLHRDEREAVSMESWSPGAELALDTTGGAEILVLEGSFEEGGDTLVRHSWLRLPAGHRFWAKAGASGARVWIKTGGLRRTDSPGHMTS